MRDLIDKFRVMRAWYPTFATLQKISCCERHFLFRVVFVAFAWQTMNSPG